MVSHCARYRLKVGMMSRLVWEDGMSWAETKCAE